MARLTPLRDACVIRASEPTTSTSVAARQGGGGKEGGSVRWVSGWVGGG
jgi:hypothetical protein